MSKKITVVIDVPPQHRARVYQRIMVLSGALIYEESAQDIRFTGEMTASIITEIEWMLKDAGFVYRWEGLEPTVAAEPSAAAPTAPAVAPPPAAPVAAPPAAAVEPTVAPAPPPPPAPLPVMAWRVELSGLPREALAQAGGELARALTTLVTFADPPAEWRDEEHWVLRGVTQFADAVEAVARTWPTEAVVDYLIEAVELIEDIAEPSSEQPSEASA